MIFEMRTYLLKPGTVGEFEARFAAGLPARAKLSPLAGLWHSEVGPLNQVIHVWPYADLNERERIRARAIETKVWPVKVQEFILEMESKILHPAPFSPNFPVGAHGPLFEFRTYTYNPGGIPRVIEAWAPRIEARSRISPLIFAGFTDLGPLNQWIHVWAYANMGERERLRAVAMPPGGNWPPPRHESVTLHRQDAVFALPAACSPCR
ncbi:MAG: NIPSNAP family protein [Enhydrobacter sp.]|nr:MAG: NIPSNAP family protein [Enhydrobacter sp.]